MRDLRGHGRVRRAVASARLADSVPQPILIHGAPGIGKQRLALWTAQLLLCPEPHKEGPCGGCKHCRLAVALEHPDLHWFFPLPRPGGSSDPDRIADALEEARGEALAERRADGLWSSRSDDVRGLYLALARTVRRKALRRPAMAERQVFIVAEAEELVPQESSPEAANALLKLLEEPPEATTFILTSSRPGRLLPTIRSRCFPLHLSGVSSGTVRSFLQEETEATAEEAERAARLAGGSIGRALELLPRAGGDAGPLQETREAAFHLLRAGISDDSARGMSVAHGYPVSGARALLERFEYLEEWIRDLAAAAAGEDRRILNHDARDYLVRVTREKDIHPVAAARALAPVEEARRLASGNVNPQLIVVGLVAELREILLAGRSSPGLAVRPGPGGGTAS